MSALGNSPAQPAPPSGDSTSDVPTWVVATAIAVAVAMALAIVGAFVFSDEKVKSSAASAPSYPDKWDRRVAPYVKIVEKQRGLDFRHPVTVRFLPDAKFEKSVTADQDDLTAEDRAEIEQDTGLLRAIGLLSGDVDLFKSVNDFSAAGTLAYYSFDDQGITIRGKKVTPAVRSTLVHELTHALQDQHFGIGNRMDVLEKQARDRPDSATASLLRAIVEGDAQRVEGLYRDSLSPQEQRALHTGQSDAGDQARQRLSDVPEMLVTILTTPYTLGGGLVFTVAADGGNAAVNELFADTPAHDVTLLDPFRVLAEDRAARDVKTPTTRRGEEELDSGAFGALTWYFMLAERLPLLEALAAADGWGGDHYVAYEKAGRTCVRIAYAGASRGDTDRMLSALRRWIAAAPDSRARVSPGGGGLRLESCDPGKKAAGGNDRSAEAVDLVSVRTGLGVGLVKAGAPTAVARCVAGRLVETYSVPQLSDPAFGADDPSVQARVQQLAADCR